ncbi:uncharacterized protein LOC103968104 isoform X2 [Pyrus x bretschneideri]|uniref:uncharacterized protein LOC103968104 isoform X2 n=1 Tax=Pyrus x bretschneideri TaxID=225117 RepID=UPI00202F915A|nr:uncharacterized protein LOC103968104 isoform X2 [Pyrus x bretschneideri]
MAYYSSSFSSSIPLPTLPDVSTYLTIKLDPTNYPLWQAQMLTLLRSRNLTSCVDGTSKCPPAFLKDDEGNFTDTVNPEFDAWIQQDAMVMSWIKSSVHPTVLGALFGKTSSHSAWTCLRDRYDLQSTGRLLQLRSELRNTHRGNSSIAEFLGRVNCLAETLSLSGAPVSESDIVAIVLNNVGPAYKGTVASAQARDEAISYSALEALMLSAERSQTMDAVFSDDTGPTGLAAARGGCPGTSASSRMAYIPPHKQHSKESETLLTPELLASQLKKNLNVNPCNMSSVDGTGRIVYADHPTHRWCAVALDDENQFPSSVSLEPVTSESAETKIGNKFLALTNTSIDNGGEEKSNLARNPGASIAENVLEDLVSSFERVRNEMKCAKLTDVNPTLVARVGKVLFHRVPSVNIESIRKKLCPEILKRWRRLFYPNVPVSYKERIVNEVVPQIGVDFEEEEDIYELQLSDSTSPDPTLSCKCRVMKEHGTLQLYEGLYPETYIEMSTFFQIKLKPVRNMVMDISCTTKNLDLRLMLCTKKLVTDLADDEMQSIMGLVNSAILDPDVKGGLRWPLGKESSGDKYKVLRVWHVRANTYRNSSLRLKVKHYDRFDFRTLTGEASWVTSLVLENVVSKLQEENVEVSSIYEMLKENMQFIWDNFLSCESFLT